MRVVVGSGPQDVKVYADSGEDITRQLGLTRLTVEVVPDEFPRLTLECLNWQGDLQIDYEQVAVEVRYLESANGRVAVEARSIPTE